MSKARRNFSRLMKDWIFLMRTLIRINLIIWQIFWKFQKMQKLPYKITKVQMGTAFLWLHGQKMVRWRRWNKIKQLKEKKSRLEILTRQYNLKMKKKIFQKKLLIKLMRRISQQIKIKTKTRYYSCHHSN
jgi:hypothetical protein